jgi:hypothetical protein
MYASAFGRLESVDVQERQLQDEMVEKWWELCRVAEPSSLPLAGLGPKIFQMLARNPQLKRWPMRSTRLRILALCRLRQKNRLRAVRIIRAA